MFLLLLLLWVNRFVFFLHICRLTEIKHLYFQHQSLRTRLFSTSFFCLLFSFFNSTNRILKYLTRNLIFHIPATARCQKGKRRVSFPCRKASVFLLGPTNCNEVSKVCVWSVFSKAGVPAPCSPHWPVADLASAPLGATSARARTHTHIHIYTHERTCRLEKQAGTLKKRVFVKGRL